MRQHHARNNHKPQTVFGFGNEFKQSDLALRLSSGSGLEERRILVHRLGGGSGFRERVLFTHGLGVIGSLGLPWLPV